MDKNTIIDKITTFLQSKRNLVYDEEDFFLFYYKYVSDKRLDSYCLLSEMMKHQDLQDIENYEVLGYLVSGQEKGIIDTRTPGPDQINMKEVYDSFPKTRDDFGDYESYKAILSNVDNMPLHPFTAQGKGYIRRYKRKTRKEKWSRFMLLTSFTISLITIVNLFYPVVEILIDLISVLINNVIDFLGKLFRIK